jgi:hypothetical protein
MVVRENFPHMYKLSNIIYTKLRLYLAEDWRYIGGYGGANKEDKKNSNRSSNSISFLTKPSSVKNCRLYSVMELAGLRQLSLLLYP